MSVLSPLRKWLNLWLSALVVILLLGLLTSCGTRQPAAQTAGSATGSGQAEHPIHLTLWQGVNPPPNREVLQKLVDRFNQSHPEIQVESLYIGQPDQQMPKILAAVVGNAPPDLLWFNPTITGQLVDLEAIRPLDDWLNQSPRRSELDPALLATMTYQGRVWSLPFATNNVGVFYRPSLFRAAGIEQLPQTWSEFRQVARQLTQDRNGDGRPDQHGVFLALGQGEFAVFTWLPFLWSAGGSLTTPPTAQMAGAVQIDNSQTIQALQFWVDLVQDGSALLSPPERGYELDDFLAGKAAMQITGPWTLGQLQQAGVDFGVFPMPRQAEAATALGGENLFVMKTSPERERAAWTFAEYVISEEFQTAWALGTGYLPVNQRSRQSQDYAQFLQTQPALQVFLDQTQVARARPLFPGYARISENLGRALEAVLLKQSSPEAALKVAQERLNLIFDAEK